jgi:signal transduction histidine kinase
VRLSLRNRLLLLFFAITAAAIGVVYLYVVPQLRSSLTAEKLSRLQARGARLEPALERAARRGASGEELDAVTQRVARTADARLTLLAVRRSPSGAISEFVIADSEAEATAVLPSYPVATAVAETGRANSAVEEVAGGRAGQSAIPIPETGQPVWIAVFSVPLSDVEDNVALIKRQILIAGIIALAAALLAGYWASRAISQRLRQLEDAAQQVAAGDFGHPIPVDSSDELGQLAGTFNEMQRRLARLDSARKQFIANASHELRTPIFSLGGFVELLDEEEPDPAARAEFMRNMRDQIERLKKLTADLLDLSRLDADAIEIRSEDFDLADLARIVVSEFEPVADHHHSNLELREAAPAVARADPDRAAQIIRILLDNALTHTPEGTNVTVTTLHENGTAQVIVGDEGRGIDTRSLGRVFDRFFTGDSATGSGLGLAIARELALRMEGRLEVVSRRGFTAFTLRLPAPVLRRARARSTE